MTNLVTRLRTETWSGFQNLAEEAASRIETLQGETGVLCDLLRECVKVIDTIQPDDVDEFDDICDLTDKVQAAIAGVGK